MGFWCTRPIKNQNVDFQYISAVCPRHRYLPVLKLHVHHEIVPPGSSHSFVWISEQKSLTPPSPPSSVMGIHHANGKCK